MKNPENIRRGKRARQRGAELQRQAVKMAKDVGLQAFNRDRGGAQHEQGDIELEKRYEQQTRWFGIRYKEGSKIRSDFMLAHKDLN